MRRLLRSALLVALPFAAQAAHASGIQTRPLANGDFEITGTFSGLTDPMAAQRLLEPAAADACAGQAYAFGHYRFDSSAPLPGSNDGKVTLTLVQDVHCGRAVATVGLPAPETPPSDRDEALIKAKTLDYLAAKDRGDFDAAYAMLGEPTRLSMGADNWRAPRAAFNAAAGGPANRNVLRVTWYDNPPSAPPGRYAAADYTASYASSAFYCGYVVWLLQPDGGYRILREDEGVATPDLVARIPAGQMAATRAQLGCRD